jgi:localization factor PodJL
VRQAADSADLRNQETLEAVHETLEQIVTKLTELETAAIGQRLSEAIAPEPGDGSSAMSSAAEPLEELPIWPGPSHDPALPMSSFAGLADEPFPQPENPFEPAIAMGEPAEGIAENPFDATVHAGREAMQAGAVQAETDDFIAAARKAAQSSIHQKSILGSVAPELARVSEVGSRKLMSFGFFKRRGADNAAKKPNPGLTGEIKYPPGFKPANENSSKKRKLIVMGLALLLVASAFTFNMMGGLSKVKLPAAPAAIEQSVSPSSSNASEPADATESLPAEDDPLDEEDPGAAVESNSQSSVQGKASSAIQESLLQDGVVDSILTSSAAPLGQSDDLAALIAGERQSPAQQPAAEAGTTALREAAAMGNASAQFVIATRYLNGEQGAPQDDAKAAYWYGRAAAQGLAPAQYRLGTLYERGKGVTRDLKSALAWYERAASLGNTKAMHNAAVLAASKDGREPDYVRAYRWFSLGAAHGLKDSQFNLAVLLERGLGTKSNPAEALFWYTVAASQNDADAAKRAEVLGKALGQATSLAVEGRAKAWKVEVAPEAANVVSVNQPAWNASGTTG